MHGIHAKSFVQFLITLFAFYAIGQTEAHVSAVAEGDSLWTIDLDKSIAIFQGVVKKDTSNSYALNQLAHAYRASNDHEKAIAVFEKLAVTPEYRNTVFFFIADAYLKLGDFESGVRYLEKSVESGFTNLYNSGFTDLATISSSPYYEALKTKEAFKKLLRKIRALPFSPQVQYLDWSPNGEELIMQAALNGSGSYDLYVYNLKHRALRRLTYTRENEMAPKWSPDGKWIVFHRSELYSGGKELFLIRSDGSEEKKLTDQKGLKGTKSFPCWSFDGNRVVFVNQDGPDANDLYTVDITEKTYTRLTRSKGIKSNPTINKDGLVVYDVQLSQNSYSLVKLDMNTGESALLTQKNWWWTPVWIPGGNSLVTGYYETGATMRNQLAMMDQDGLNKRIITNYGEDAWFPSPSPDGRKIAFAAPVNPFFMGGSTLKILDLASGEIAHIAISGD
ncbi:hypothetical protein [Spongiimicrobium sp. 2-473A-2-J]|uniref:hypothetical protein n=1 Tax=Eudoraea algarum TaxID=3417568 RepID=UPI003D359D1D